MIASDNLHQLIKTLSKSEKGYFKKYSAIHGNKESKNYLALFNAIDKQVIYDEQALKIQLNKKEGLIKRFAFYKKYLFELIMKSVRSYRSESSVISQIENSLQNTGILFEKGLANLCLKEIKKGKKLALKNERHLYYLEFLERENSVLNLIASNQHNETFVNKNFKEGEETLSLELNKLKFVDIHNQLIYLVRRIGAPRDNKTLAQYQAIMANPMLASTKQCKCFYSTTYYLHLWNLYYGITGQWKKSRDYGIKLVKYFENSPVDWSIKASNYISTLNNLLNILSSLKEHSLFDKTIEKLKETPFSSINHRVRALQFYYMQLLKRNIDRIQPIKNCSMSDEVSKFIKSNNKLISKDNELNFYLALFYSYFICKEHSSSLMWLNKIIHDNKHLDIRTDIRKKARFLTLIVHYELKNYDLLEYTLKSTKNNFAKKDSLYIIESITIKLLRSLIKTNNNLQKIKLLKEALYQLKKEEHKNEVEIFITSFDIICWLESKIENKTFEEMMKGKVEYIDKQR